MVAPIEFCVETDHSLFAVRNRFALRREQEITVGRQRRPGDWRVPVCPLLKSDEALRVRRRIFQSSASRHGIRMMQLSFPISVSGRCEVEIIRRRTCVGARRLREI
jgi:hypothetical protein